MHGLSTTTAAPRGLTRAERKEETRQAVLVAAAALFAEAGIEASSVEQIASSIGLTRGAVYSSFSSKHDLIRTVGEAQTIRLDLECLWRQELPLEERLRLLGAEVARFVGRHAPGALVLDLEFLLYAVRHREDSADRFHRNRVSAEYIGDRLADVERARGGDLPLPPALFGRLLVATVRGLLQEDLRQDQRLQASEWSEALAHLAGRP